MKTLSIENIKFWPMTNCWDCNQPINNKEEGCWYKFVVIGGTQFQVPQCDECMKNEPEIHEKAE